MPYKLSEADTTLNADNLYHASSTIPGFLVILGAFHSALETAPSRAKVIAYADWLYSVFHLSNYEEGIQTFCTGLMISVDHWLDTQNYEELTTSIKEVMDILTEDLQ